MVRSNIGQPIGHGDDVRVIARLEHGPKGANPRYVITNLEAKAEPHGHDPRRRAWLRGEVVGRGFETRVVLIRRVAIEGECPKTGRNRLRRETGPTITSPKAPHH